MLGLKLLEPPAALLVRSWKAGYFPLSTLKVTSGARLQVAQ
jgi:hypothetical protein